MHPDPRSLCLQLGGLILWVWGACPLPWEATCCPGAAPEAGAWARLFRGRHRLCWILQRFRESAPVPTRSLLAEWAGEAGHRSSG